MDEYLKRIDEHMARGNELMEEVREEFRLNREEHRKNREAFELYKLAMAQMLDDNKQFMRTIFGQLEELRKDSRAHSEALFRMIERLDRWGGGAATT
jgi:hypothetical protein